MRHRAERAEVDPRALESLVAGGELELLTAAGEEPHSLHEAREVAVHEAGPVGAGGDRAGDRLPRDRPEDRQRKAALGELGVEIAQARSGAGRNRPGCLASIPDHRSSDTPISSGAAMALQECPAPTTRSRCLAANASRTTAAISSSLFGSCQTTGLEVTVRDQLANRPSPSCGGPRAVPPAIVLGTLRPPSTPELDLAFVCAPCIPMGLQRCWQPGGRQRYRFLFATAPRAPDAGRAPTSSAAAPCATRTSERTSHRRAPRPSRRRARSAGRAREACSR